MKGVIKLVQPQELEALYVLPALRREIAKAMREQGVEQKEVARRLAVTEAAVSQYVHGKRGSDVVFDKSAQARIARAAKKITGPESLLQNVQELLSYLWQKRTMCAICHDHNPQIPTTCKVCFT